MVSKSQIKLITSLEQKKSRAKTGLFVVEGKKGIAEILQSTFRLYSLYTIEDVFDSPKEKTVLVSSSELKKMSRLKTPQTAVAVFEIPRQKAIDTSELIIALDGIRDPGNLGTIIRLCDWFGVENLICSNDTVDCYNPKVVQATMGSITRVNVQYLDLEIFLKKNPDLPLMGTFLQGEDIYSTNLPQRGILVLGNEANGISDKIEKLVTSRFNIPQFGEATETESLNVATATAVLLGEFRRQKYY